MFIDQYITDTLPAKVPDSSAIRLLSFSHPQKVRNSRECPQGEIQSPVEQHQNTPQGVQEKFFIHKNPPKEHRHLWKISDLQNVDGYPLRSAVLSYEEHGSLQEKITNTRGHFCRIA